jgi:hypothetical protein
MRYLSFALFALGSLASQNLPPIHYTISRRGGSFPAPDIANLTYLLEQLQVVEQRYNATTRDFIGNKVVRRPKRLHGTQASSILLGDVGREGNWFASLHIGDAVQEVDMDLDMLTADWWIFSTSSGKGSFYLDFNSKTYGKTSLISLDIRKLTEFKLTQSHHWLSPPVVSRRISSICQQSNNRFLFLLHFAGRRSNGSEPFYHLAHT